MAKGIKEEARAQEREPVSLNELIHQHQPLLKAAPLSKSTVSRVVATLKNGLEAWRTRSLADLDVIYVYLDGFALHEDARLAAER